MLNRSKPLIMFLALIALTVSSLSAAARAGADPLPVTFAGEVDSDGPLVIDPSSSDDPQTLTVQNAGADVYYIERMPQTKSVTSITLGDFGQGSCSSGSPTARLFIYSRDNNDYNGPSTEIAYTNEVALPTTPGRLTFSFDWVRSGGSTLLMSAGRAYVFGMSLSGCSSFLQTTWAPLEPRMETSSHSCISAMPYGPYGSSGGNMQWHGALTMPDPACVGQFQDLWDSEPDGWLVSITPAWTPYIEMIRNIGYWAGDPDDIVNHYCDTTSHPGQDVTQLNVMMPSGQPGVELDGVCRRNAFYPPGQQTRYTWSTALPWRTETGSGPRMPYLRLDTVNWDNTLLDQYAPAMKFDTSEAFLPEDARGVASIAPSDGSCSDDANGLSNRHQAEDPDTHLPVTVDTRYADAGSVACPAANQLAMDDLGPVGAQYPYVVGGQHPLVAARDGVFGDHLSLRGDTSTFAGDSRSIYDITGWGNHVYGRVVQGTSGELWLQYYFWYYYNNGYTVIPGTDDHEGDWEGIQVHIANPFSSNPVPDHATYDEHNFRSVCGWDQVEVADGHPVVYVSKGRHASYYTPDKMPSGVSAADGGSDASPDATDATVNTASVVPHVEAISAYTPGWIRWPGRWGDSDGDWTGTGGKSPTGPATFSMWSDPAQWDSPVMVGDHNSDAGCPDSLPAGRAAAKVVGAKVGTPVSRTHSTSGDGDGPALRWTRAAGGRIRVTWSLGDAAAARPVTLALSVHATDLLYPASLKQVDLRSGRRHGSVVLDLPAKGGAFELVGQVLAGSGAWSSETTRAVTAG